MPVRRALCAVIGSFHSGEDEPPTGTPADIPGADALRGQMTAALARLGYHCVTLNGNESAAELGTAVLGFLREPMPAGGVRVVHVLSHGVQPPNYDGLEVLGADGRADELTDVAGWVRRADRDPDAPATLFLLDVCQAGTAVRLPYQLTIDRRRTVVLAASPADEPAYDANFTRAMIAALGKVADGGYNVARGFGSIAPRQVALDVQAQVAAHGHGQQVTCSLFSLLDGEPDFAFFPNLVPADADLLPDGVDPGLGDLALGLDPAHFVDRAYAHGPRPRMRTGLFYGRDRLLGELSAWLDEIGPPEPGQGLRVVTGSPGSGKSALLGVLVCAAHPGLREATDPAWNRLPHVPSRNEHLVAVHARQLTTQQIIDSLARQLHLPPPGLRPHEDGGEQDERMGPAAPAQPAAEKASAASAGGGAQHGWTTADLLEAITTGTSPPVIVVDAVDEAAQPSELIQQVLLPLATRTHPRSPLTADPADGDEAGNGDGGEGGGGWCRLLVGTRAWASLQPLLQAARDHGHLIDLDQEPPTEVRAALTGYVTALLDRQPPYDTAAYKTARAHFAEALAATLTTRQPPAPASPAGTVTDPASPAGLAGVTDPGDPADPRWGAFLVAALYTHHKITAQALPPDPAFAWVLGGQVPRTLWEVMEMDLQARATDPWARPLLASLAYARGDGMPLDVLTHVAPVFHHDGPHIPDPAPAQARHTLAGIRFYLRLTPDQHGVIHYRLFHQGLTDYLRHHPTAPPAP
ncbi:AAA ATPase domain-containing protein [Thermomonospora echinospora]|uniref:AAA ATPase domain-containing protein n=1 Tax=Thermomonospora echinospora TaxID=1992 RepID=A0A1H6E9C5_9ACTN|nr:ATP-binding protein [Thermomonospora echinospora]SEG94292.1 AAA ATPase domain-containing protein [Thermomonospora echinospora]